MFLFFAIAVEFVPTLYILYPVVVSQLHVYICMSLTTKYARRFKWIYSLFHIDFLINLLFVLYRINGMMVVIWVSSVVWLCLHWCPEVTTLSCHLVTSFLSLSVSLPLPLAVPFLGIAVLFNFNWHTYTFYSCCRVFHCFSLWFFEILSKRPTTQILIKLSLYIHMPNTWLVVCRQCLGCCLACCSVSVLF